MHTWQWLIYTIVYVAQTHGVVLQIFINITASIFVNALVFFTHCNHRQSG